MNSRKMSDGVKAAVPRFTCTQCDKHYASKQTLKTHMTKAHTVSVDSTIVMPNTEDLTIVTPVTETEKIVSQNSELDVDDDVMVDAKEEQDLYDSLDELIKKIDDPDKANDTKEELLEKVKRLQTIVKKKTDLLQKKDCDECVKRAEVEKDKERLLEEKDKEIKQVKEEKENAITESKKKKEEIKGLKQNMEQASETIKLLRESKAEVVKLNCELTNELEESKKLVVILRAAVEVENEGVEVIKPKEKVKMNKVSTPMCVTCDKKFRSNADLEKHMEDKHTQPECRVCQRFFTGRQELSQHMKIHENTILACSECPLVAYQDQEQAKNHPHKLHVSTNHSVCTNCGEWGENSHMRKHFEEEHNQKGGRFKEVRRPCKYFPKGICWKGNNCPFSHVGGVERQQSPRGGSGNTGRRSTGPEAPRGGAQPCRNGPNCPWQVRGQCHFGHGGPQPQGGRGGQGGPRRGHEVPRGPRGGQEMPWGPRGGQPRNCRFGDSCRDLPHCRFTHNLQSLQDFPQLPRTQGQVPLWYNNLTNGIINH